MVSEEVVFVVVVVSDEVVDGGGVVDELSGVEDESDVEVLVEGVVSDAGGVETTGVGDAESADVSPAEVGVGVTGTVAVPAFVSTPYWSEITVALLSRTRSASWSAERFGSMTVNVGASSRVKLSFAGVRMPTVGSVTCTVGSDDDA